VQTALICRGEDQAHQSPKRAGRGMTSQQDALSEERKEIKVVKSAKY
jgi:hypothetical protein